MPVVNVRKLQVLDEVLVSRDETVGDGIPHQRTQTIKVGLRQVRVSSPTSSRHLLEYLICPLRLHQPGPGYADEQVAHRIAVQGIGVVEHDES